MDRFRMFWQLAVPILGLVCSGVFQNFLGNRTVLVPFVTILCHTNGQNCEEFVIDCRKDLIFDINPNCNSIQYSGRLRCCKHKEFLLDIDQEIRPEILRYHMKIRFWFQEYNQYQYQIEKIYSFDASKLLINNVFNNENILIKFFGMRLTRLFIWFLQVNCDILHI